VVFTHIYCGRPSRARSNRTLPIPIANRVLICNRVAGFIIVGGQDNIQMVAGRMLGFFAELGFIFPQFPFIAHSRGWSPEDMENNVAMERNSKELADGACMLAKRLLDLAARLIAQDEAPASIERGAARPIRCRWGGDAREAYMGPDLAGAKPADEWWRISLRGLTSIPSALCA